MAKGNVQATQREFHTPILLEWTDERLRQLDQEQLLNLLHNLAHQRQIGRLKADTALMLEERIAPLVAGRKGSELRKRLAKQAAEAKAAEAKADEAKASEAKASTE